MESVMPDQSSTNPLLSTAELPLFDEFTHEHVEDAVEHLITTVESNLKAIEESSANTFQDVYLKLDAIDAYIEKTWMPVLNMQSVMNTEPIRKAYEKVLPRFVVLSLRIKQSKPHLQQTPSIAQRQQSLLHSRSM